MSFLSVPLLSPWEAFAWVGWGKGPAGRSEDFRLASWPRNLSGRRTRVTGSPGSRRKLGQPPETPHFFVVESVMGRPDRNSRGGCHVCLQAVIYLGGRPDRHTRTHTHTHTRRGTWPPFLELLLMGDMGCQLQSWELRRVSESGL